MTNYFSTFEVETKLDRLIAEVLDNMALLNDVSEWHAQ